MQAGAAKAAADPIPGAAGSAEAMRGYLVLLPLRMVISHGRWIDELYIGDSRPDIFTLYDGLREASYAGVGLDGTLEYIETEYYE